MNQQSCSIGPQQFDFKEESCAIDWKNWLRSFELFADASDMANDKKKSWLLHYAGPKVQSIYYNLPGISKDNRRSARTQYRKAVEKLTEYFAPKQNTSYERHIFRNLSQRQGERIDTFVMRLRVQADRCEFGSRVDDNIKDQVTSACYSDSLRRKILERNHKTLESVMKLCRIFESVANQEKSFVVDSKREGVGATMNGTTDVCSIADRKRFISQYKANTDSECSRCAIKGHKSDDNNCPAKGKKCGRCGKMDHFARKCCTKLSSINGNSSGVKREPVRMIEDYDDYDDSF